MEIKELSQINYASYNPRILTDQVANNLDRSMTTFGDISGITLNAASNTLVTGHQRLRLLDKRFPGRVKFYIEHRLATPDEYGTVATGYVGVEGMNLRMAYREVYWDQGTEKAANIAANKIEADFDNEKLAALDYDLSLLENGAELLALSGQSEAEIEKLLKMVGVGDEPEPAEDESEADDDKLTFAIAKDQRPTIDQALASVKQRYAIPHTNLDNINGTALYILSRLYLENATSQNIESSPQVTPQVEADQTALDSIPTA